MTTPSRPETDAVRRFFICAVTGFSSGLPLYILINLLSAWLREGGVNLKDIGLLALVQIPYVWKFLWAPWCDRYGFALGRRRSWMLASQTALLLTIPLLGYLHPADDMATLRGLALIVALFSATQDIAIDAFRRELLREHEQGLGNVIHVNAYKIAGLVPGSLSLILADSLSWDWVFLITALFMLPGWLLTLWVSEPLSTHAAPASLGQAVVDPLREFIRRKGWLDAVLVLTFIFFYKLGDSMATSLATPFYLDLGYSKTQIGLIAKNAGLWPNLMGGLLGGIWLMRLGLRRALWLFGLVQALVIPGFAWLATLPPDSTRLAWVIGSEAFGVGLGTAAFVAYLATLTHPAYTATQFALFTSLAATPRTLANALAGFLVEGGDIPLGQIGIIHFAGWGWQTFFWVCFGLALPGLLLLLRVNPDQ